MPRHERCGLRRVTWPSGATLSALLASVVSAGCGGETEPRRFVTIDSPKDEAVVTTESVTVSGRASGTPVVTIAVEDCGEAVCGPESVPVREGRYSFTARPEPGKKVEICATPGQSFGRLERCIEVTARTAAFAASERRRIADKRKFSRMLAALNRTYGRIPFSRLEVNVARYAGSKVRYRGFVGEEKVTLADGGRGFTLQFGSPGVYAVVEGPVPKAVPGDVLVYGTVKGSSRFKSSEGYTNTETVITPDYLIPEDCRRTACVERR